MLRWIFAVGAVLASAGSVGLGQASRSVLHYPVVLQGDVPAVVYEPGRAQPPGQRAPVVVLVHGFAGDAAAVSTLARRLARSGFGVVTPELRGHGRSRASLPPHILEGPRDVLRADIDAAVLFARSQPAFDPERVALAGHSMGASAVLDYASFDPGVGAVIAISGGRPWSGPYAPPNVLLAWAEGDLAESKLRIRRLGQRLARLEQIVVDRAYGDMQRGTAVKATEVSGADHWSVLHSTVTGDRILDWLERSIGPGGPAQGDSGDGRAPWSGLTLLGLILVLYAVVAWLPHATPAEPAGPTGALRAQGELLAALAVACALAPATDAAGALGPVGFVPLAGGHEALALLMVAGLPLCALWSRQGWIPPSAPAARSLLGAAGLLALLYLVGGAALAPYGQVWLTPERALWWGVSSILALPFALAVEHRLRAGPGLGILAARLSARLLTVLALVLLGVQPTVSLDVLIVTARVAPLLLAFELLALRLGRATPDPWLLATLHATWLAWLLAASSPIEGP